MAPAEVVAEVTDSGLRGRGGAGFPAGIKWKTVLDCADELKFVCCNADEGDSGTFADRMLMEGDPFLLIEGMTIAAYAVGATRGLHLHPLGVPGRGRHDARRDRDRPRREGWLGDGVLGSALRFDLHVRVGGRRLHLRRGDLDAGEPRGQARHGPRQAADPGHRRACSASRRWSTTCSPSPPCPTVLADGAEAYSELGVGRSRGTQVFQLGGNIAHGGIVETAFGITLGELVDGYGGGTRSGRPVRAVQVGGPLGAYLPTSKFDLPMDYEAFAAAGAMVGHGGIVVFDDTVDMAAQARFAMEFCAEESCGKCTPCRVGSVRGVEVIDRIIARRAPRREPGPARRPLRGDDRGLAVRDGRPHADAGAQCALRTSPRTSSRRQPIRRQAPHISAKTEVSHEPAQGARLRHAGQGRPGDGLASRSTGCSVSVPEGTSVMRAAALAGVDVPKLCATDRLDAFGSCRLCLVEIDGRRGTPASCTTPVADGMVVRTQTPKVAKLRESVMELYISDHPLDCLTCPANGDCELQDMAGVVGLRQVRYGYEGENHLDAVKDQSNPYFDFDPSKCIACSRCVRACDEIQGTFALTIEGRGFDVQGVAGCGRVLHGLRVRVLRRLRAGLPDGHASGTFRDRAGHAVALGDHHLRLLRRRVFVQGGAAR